MVVPVLTQEDLAFATRVERLLLTYPTVVFAAAQVDPLSKKVHVWAGVPHGEPEHNKTALRQSVARQIQERLEDLVVLEGVLEEKLSCVPKSSQQA